MVFSGGKIIAVLAPDSEEARLLSMTSLTHEVKATGMMVVPGLVDLHVHVSVCVHEKERERVCVWKCICACVRETMCVCMIGHVCECELLSV